MRTHGSSASRVDHEDRGSCAPGGAGHGLPNLLFFEALSSQQFLPTVFVDIGSVIHQKLGALEANASQVQKMNIQAMTIVDIAQSAAHFRGIQGRVTYAEGFVPLRHFIL